MVANWVEDCEQRFGQAAVLPCGWFLAALVYWDQAGLARGDVSISVLFNGSEGEREVCLVLITIVWLIKTCVHKAEKYSWSFWHSYVINIRFGFY